MKTCTKCAEAKPVSEFSKDAGKRDGLHSNCKTCAKTRHSEWRAANPEKVKARNAVWYAENREKHRANMIKWQKANPEKLKANYARWYAANPEKHRAACRISGHNRRARKRDAGGKLSTGLSEKLMKLQRGKCACGCKQSLGDDFHLDHIVPLALGGSNTDDNMQLLRKICNLQKSARHPVDFMQQRGFLL